MSPNVRIDVLSRTPSIIANNHITGRRLSIGFGFCGVVLVNLVFMTPWVTPGGMKIGESVCHSCRE